MAWCGKRYHLPFAVAIVMSSAILLFFILGTFEDKWNGFPRMFNPPLTAAVKKSNGNDKKRKPSIILPRICDNTYASFCGKSTIFYDLRSALEHQVSEAGVVFLAGLVDGGYVDLAANLHVSSIAPHNICNIIYIVIDESTLNKTQEYNMPVYFYEKHIVHKSVGKYNSPAFKEKTKIKLEITQIALQMGYTVMLTDLDMYFKNNPLLSIDCGKNCDFAIQNNDHGKGHQIQLNSGFILVKSNTKTMQLYQELVKKSPSFGADDQVLFNKIFYSKRVPDLKMVVLPKDKFCVGRKTEVTRCVVFHANFARGLAAKKKKLQSHKMWVLGTPDAGLYHCEILGHR